MSFHTNRDINVFKVVSQFERRLASYSGSKHAVCVDSCTNALFLSLMYLNIKGEEVTIPCRTYPSVPNSIIHAGGRVIFKDVDWRGIYQLKPFPVIDGAKRFRANMYEKGTLHCLSFHIKKILGLGSLRWSVPYSFIGRHLYITWVEYVYGPPHGCPRLMENDDDRRQ